MINTSPYKSGSGLSELAKYSKQELEEYNRNPLIESLPAILSEDDFIESVANYPLFSESERELPSHVRVHCVMRLSQYFQPTSKHIDLEQKISLILRQGYLSRNPLLPEFKQKLREIRENFQTEIGEGINDKLRLIDNIARNKVNGFTMIGVSGVGKSTALNKILDLYPQVVVHSDYDNKPLALYQLTHLKLDCPHAGSLKGLCIDFFRNVDNLLPTNYYEKFGVSSSRKSEDLLLAQMAQIAYLYNLGILIIDEIQHLSEAKSGGKEKMLNFFVKLQNTIGVPVILVGTNKAIKILQGDFRQGRRGTGVGSLYWERFLNNSLDERETWNFFVEELFDYQWTKEKVDYNKEFSDVIYDESQGIIDIAIKLYMITQWRAINTGYEKITPELIQQVSLDSLHLVRPMLDALRSGNPERIARYSDIEPVDIEQVYEQYKTKLSIKNQQIIENQRNKYKEVMVDVPDLNKIVLALLDLRIPHKLAMLCAEEVYAELKSDDTIEALIKRAYSIATTAGFDAFKNNYNTPKQTKKIEKKYISGDLRVIVENAQKTNLSAYEGLKNSGVIKSPIDELKIA